MSDTHPHRTTQGGFQLLRSTPATISVWTKLVLQFVLKMKSTAIGAEMGDGGSEQIMMNNLVRKEPFLKLNWLDPALFVSGQYYTRGGKSPSNPIVILNNWIIGNAAKKKRAKIWRHWFTDEIGNCLSNTSPLLGTGMSNMVQENNGNRSK
eukprot:CAMPEP_0173079144 /NCGR_PEP_ID=MMETSP1102-20130122/14869_1 /TAXON_ID=49646 /ORGANISM="Geminigera sp., Strain Caron Lab Isolate" /LENGTH=150 /DNA_ID=CAMNT_0013951211 /DNA_START=290 /DNA_END=742 /DNA_ORIENTATION=-